MNQLQAYEFKRHQKMVRGFFKTGVAQVVFGILAVVLGVISLSIRHIHDTEGFLIMSSHMNVWSNFVFCITGGIGIATKENPSSTLASAYFRLGLFSILLSFALLMMNIFGLVSAHAISPIVAEGDNSLKITMMAIHSTLTAIGILQMNLFLVSIAYKCCRPLNDANEQLKCEQARRRQT
ncbi:uncharacterized protein LOC120346309 [Styela clava]